MWNFRNFTIGFFLILLLFNILAFFSCPGDSLLLNFFCTYRLHFYSLLIYLFLFIPVILAFFPCTEFHHKPVICRLKTNERLVLLTFDDGPDPEITPEILEILRRNGIRAIFFVIGKKIRGNEDLIRKIAEYGHDVGNHSFSHTNLWDFKTGKKIREEILLTNSLIYEATGIKPRYFRPPYGVINPMVHNGLKNTGLTVVAWSRRSLDTLPGNETALIRKMTGKLSSGDILLFHDTSRLTANSLETFIAEVKTKGFHFAGPDLLPNPQNDE